MAIFNCYVSSPEGNHIPHGLNGNSPLKTHGLFVESAGIRATRAGRGGQVGWGWHCLPGALVVSSLWKIDISMGNGP